MDRQEMMERLQNDEDGDSKSYSDNKDIFFLIRMFCAKIFLFFLSYKRKYKMD